MKLPQEGRSREEVIGLLENYRSDDFPWRNSRSFSYVFHAKSEVEQLAKAAYMQYLSENGLDPTMFPSLRRFESEIVSMAIGHLRGGDEAAGNFTSGGTESIILACKTAREYARSKNPALGRPQIILPETAHAAFHKAGCYLELDVVVTPVDPVTMKADVAAMRDAITENTILLVGSAVSYGPGVVDPIEELGQLALEHDLLLHVDGCMGGFLLPYFRRLGRDVPNFDFTVPGVTSISMDLHKYAYVPKGASVIVYKTAALRRHQLFACAGWGGYTMINNTIQSSKSGGPVAAAWAVMNYLGDDGYLELARTTLEATENFVEGIRSTDGVDLLVDPEMSLLAFTSEEADIMHVIDEMNGRGWYVQPQPGFGDGPASAHITVTHNHLAHVDEFLADLQLSVDAAKRLPPPGLPAHLKAAIEAIDVSTVTPEALSGMLAMVGIQGKGLPKRMADINSAIISIPPKLSEQFLIEFFNNLFRAS